MNYKTELQSNNADLAAILEAVNALPEAGSGGSAPVEEKDVNFYDYDGTLLYSYTVDEAHALTELPALPSHDGLVCQGWNWTLAELKSLNRAMNVGAVYITDDGKTRLHLNITSIYQCEISLYIIQSVSNGVKVDWGDGTATETINGTGNVNISHVYTNVGRYIVSLEVTSGTLKFGANSANYMIMGAAVEQDKYKLSILEKVEIGAGVQSLGSYAFKYAFGLKHITIPNSVTNMSEVYYFFHARRLSFIVIPSNVDNLGACSFDSTVNLEGICFSEKTKTLGVYLFSENEFVTSFELPNGVTKLDNGLFSGCKLLKKFLIQDSVTILGISAFQNCHNLIEITIPSGVTSIGGTAFNNCYGMRKMKFLPAMPPTVASSSAFNNLPSTCVVEVPKGTLATYQAATNYSGIAARMVESES